MTFGNLPEPSFWNGAARVLDLGGTFDPDADEEYDGDLADYEALAADWAAIGFDLKPACERVHELQETASAVE